MSDERNGKTAVDGDDATKDAKLLDMLAAALTEDGELLPTTEAEVAAVEEELEAVELPAHLRELKLAGDERDERADVSGLADYRSRREERGAFSPWSHVGALLIGAAAAAAVAIAFDRTAVPDLPVGGDPAGVPSSLPAPPAPPIVAEAVCDACCGGQACGDAKPETSRCGSGHACIACDPAVLGDSRYRIRVGAVTAAPLGERVIRDYPQGEPELCVRAGVSKELCVPTQVSDRDGGRWTVLPAVFSGDDLSAKLAVRLRWKGVARESLATAGRWTMPVALTPRSLCAGYTVELLNGDKEEMFGTLSLFMDDAHYVEIMRAEGTAPLRDLRGRMTLKGLVALPGRLHLRETEGEGARRFVLAAGPFNRKTAEQLRWQLLEQDLDARATVGLDYVGDPLPLP